MSTLVLDASVILAAFDEDDAHHEAAKAILADAEITLATLDLARYEVANVAVRAWGQPDVVAALLDAVDRIGDDGGIHLSETALLAEAAKLAQEQSLSVYDAAYVAASSSSGRTLVSCDERDLLSKGLAISPEEARERTTDGDPSSLSD